MTSSPLTSNPTNRTARRSLARRGGAVGAGGVLVAGTAAALLTAFAGQAGAASTITVDSNGDGTATASNCTDGTSGNCTIRDAAAAAVDGDTITFDAAISTITLTNGGIALGAVNITGPGSASLAITTTAAAGSYDLFYLLGTGDVTVSGLSITKNRIKTINQGKFTLNDVSISGCYTSYGGALYATNQSDLVISGSHFENNSAALKGGAVYAVNNGAVTISDTEFIDNTVFQGNGGGIFSKESGQKFTLTGSTVTGNSATRGGGISVATTALVSIADSTISSNTSTSDGAGLYSYVAPSANQRAAVSIERSTFDGNTLTGSGEGGGMKVGGRSLEVTNSTISDNSSGNIGGGISVSEAAAATINNTTITGNSAAGNGGGLYANGVDVTINQGTISANSAGDKAGGVWLYRESLNLSGTIVSGNSSVTPGSEDVGVDLVLGLYSDHSLVGNVDGVTVFDQGGTIRSTTPGLDVLADNGGPTMTMALLTGSAAIDAGPNPVATFTGNGFDQRGTPYARVYNGTVDIGAFEVQGTPPPTSSTTSSSTSSTTSSTTVPTSSTSSSSTVPTSSTTTPGPTTTVVVDPTTTTTEEDVMVPAFTG